MGLIPPWGGEAGAGYATVMGTEIIAIKIGEKIPSLP